MIKKNNNGATLEDLASMIAKGFENTVTKSDLKDLEVKLGNRIDGIDKRLGKLEFQVDEV